MTVYNGMYRCDGGQHPPLTTIRYRRTLLGECKRCGNYFKLYTNGTVVMHKRKFTRGG